MDSPKPHHRKPPCPVPEGRSSVAQNPILCVDDNTTHLELYRELLERDGYQVITCADCYQALEVFRTNAVGLVLLDYSMPQMNGAEVARAMRIEHSNVPIVMLSGELERPHDVGNAVDAYIVKGRDPLILLEEIRSLIARQAGSSARRKAL